MKSNTFELSVLCERSQIKLLYHNHNRDSFYKNKSKYAVFLSSLQRAVNYSGLGEIKALCNKWRASIRGGMRSQFPLM